MLCYAHDLCDKSQCQTLCRMLDADATKPDDWDEDAPRQIEDDDAEKPDGWLDDEPAEIDDPGTHQIVTPGLLRCSFAMKAADRCMHHASCV